MTPTSLARRRAIGYARTSGLEKEKNTSPQAQRSDITAYAAHKHFDLIDLVTEAYSGFTDNRPCLNELFERADRGEFDVLIIAESSRIGRDRYLQNVIWAFDRFGVDTWCVEDDARLNDEDDEQTQIKLGADTFISGVIRRDVRKRTRRGMIQKAAGTKRPIGAGAVAPYGYMWAGFGKTRALKPNPATAPYLEELFQRYAAGESVNTICADFAARQIPRPGATDEKSRFRESARPFHWSPTSVYPMLRNETYTGTYQNFGARTQKPRNRVSQTPIPAPCPQLIDRALFAAVQQRLDSGNTRAIRNAKRIYLLRARFTCVCGGTMTGETKGGISYYRCINSVHRIQRKHPCERRGVRLLPIDAAVWRWVEAELLTERTLRASLERITASTSVQTKKLQAIIDRARAAIGELAAREEALLEAELSGKYRPELIARKLADAAAAQDREQQALEQAEQDLAALGADAATIEQILAEVRTYKADDYNEDDKRRILDALNVTAQLMDGQPTLRMRAKVPRKGGFAPLIESVVR